MRGSAGRMLSTLADAARGVFAGGRASMTRGTATGPAWIAWRAGDVGDARRRAEASIGRNESLDEAHHLLALAAHITGDHAAAIAAHQAIGPEYRRLSELDEPVLWSHVRSGDLAGAQAFARHRGLLRDKVVRERLRLATEKPLTVEVDGVVEIPFTDDRLTPLMPGVAARVNGYPAAARLDTGGAFMHLSAGQAAPWGIGTVACEREFAGLRFGQVCHGVADLELGPVLLRNVPVAVHRRGLGAGPIAAAFGVRLGPVIGTNVLQQFLATVDTPAQRLILSPRADAAARSTHLARLGSDLAAVPFMMWLDHFMIARGYVGGHRDRNFFIDSGLVAVHEAQGQAAMLAPRSALAAWNVPEPEDKRFAALPGALALGSVAREGMTVCAVPDRTWRHFGDWGGIRVDALVGYGFLKRYAWTLDFDRRVYLFGAGAPRGGRS